MKNTNSDFFDIYYQQGEKPAFCFRSGLAVYEESFVNGALVTQGWNAAGYPLNVLSNCPSRMDYIRFSEPFAFNLEINGIRADCGLEFEGFETEKTEGGILGILKLRSAAVNAQICVYTFLDGTQMLTRWLSVKNLSDSALNLSRLCPVAGGLEIFDRAQLTCDNDVEKHYSLGCFNDDEWGCEGSFVWRDIRKDSMSLDTCFGRDRHRHPLVFIRNNLTGMMWFVQLGWSGGFRFTTDYNAKKERRYTTLSFKAEITGHAPLIVLAPGESYTSAQVHIGAIQGGLDEAVNEMHTHIRKSVLNLPEAAPGELLIGCGMGAEHDMSVETSKAFIDQFARMGGEVFIIDAGWQNPPDKEMCWVDYNGLNVPDAARYPNGISELSDYCHEKGLKFALWVEIERLGSKCGAYTAHPEWRLENIYGIKHANQLDMTNPEAAKWAEDELARIITEYKLDLLRIDFNVSYKEYFGMRDTAYGYKECATLRHYDAVYAMYQRLKKRFPDVIFENCAGGGARTDLGMMKAFNHTWVSDWQKLPRSPLITSGMTMALPPERVDRLFAGMGCHEFGGIDAHMRNTMLGHMSLNVVAPASALANPVQMQFIQHSIEIYKSFIRPFLAGCKVWHHTPDREKASEDGCTMLEISAPDCSRGALAVFTLVGAKAQRFICRPKGIDAAKTYSVTLDNSSMSFEISGRELSNNGILLNIPSSLSSELVLYREI